MPSKPRIILDTLLKIVLCVSLVISALCLMWGSLNIYFSAEDHPYTREIVAEVFGKICIPVYISLALIVLSGILSFFSDGKATKKRRISSAYLLAALSDKKDLRSTPELYERISAEHKKRRIYAAVTVGVSGVLSGIFLSFALNPANFHRSDINGSMIKAMAVLTPCLIIAFAVALIFHFFVEKSRKREIEALKTAPIKVKNDSEATDALKRSEQSEKRLFMVKMILLAVFAAIAVFGFFIGGTEDVLTKAVNICTECIGLG